jgi:hypothetical protein
MLREEHLEIAGVPIIRLYIEVKGKQYIGDAEIKINAKPGTADGDSPISCAQTSALGRALGFAGYGSLESIATDEIHRNQEQQSEPASSVEVGRVKGHVGRVFNFKEADFEQRWEAAKVHVLGRATADPDLTKADLDKLHGFAVAEEKKRAAKPVNAGGGH